ncbi:hypothetical protein NEDG_00747 [Nematocida displodere]|uniref:F-box domain-containing protein n=1 Tax=Nematocida displodere TaxID=1805483 RepID=A0A177ECD8_9MICR|nr:hypothetical protein NEDG_00747 [Nematocida displodere]
MKRLGGRRSVSLLPATKREESLLPWKYIEGFSGWFIYKLSKYLPTGAYPISSKICSGRKIKTRHRINLSRLSGDIGTLDLSCIMQTKGHASNCTIQKVRVRNTEITDRLWEVIKLGKIIILEDSEIRRYRDVFFKNALSIDILGSSVEQIKHCVIDLLKVRRRRIRINNANILIFWDEYKDCTFAIRYADVVGVMQCIPLIRVAYFDQVDITPGVIKELAKHPVVEIRLTKCYVLPLKLYDLLDACRTTLRLIEFSDTLVTPSVIDYFKENSITVILNK